MSNKATRIEYMNAVESFFDSNKHLNYNNALEVSGKTTEWLSKFKNYKTTSYPDIDAESLPFDNETYNCVILNQVLEHCQRPWICINEAYRVLKKQGIVILSSPFFYQIHEWPGDYYRFTPEGLIAMAKHSGFTNVLLNHRAGNPGMIKHMINNPDDRKSNHFMNLAKTKNADQSKYFTVSTVIMQK